MPVIIERVGSRGITVGVETPSVDLLYTVVGTLDETLVCQEIEATIPAFWTISTSLGLASLVFQNYRIGHLGNDVWEAEVRYGKREVKKPGDSTFSFDTTGGTAKFTQSLETMATYARPDTTTDPPWVIEGVAPDFKGAIGVNDDKVEGVDIVIPKASFSETHYFPLAALTAQYKRDIFLLTGKTNDAPWRGMGRGEVLFLGARGSARNNEDAEISFNFEYSPDAIIQNIGGIPGDAEITNPPQPHIVPYVIRKGGHEYLWVRYEEKEDAGPPKRLVKVPSSVHVERVYEFGDFLQLGIGE